MKLTSFSELIAEIVDALSDKTCDELAEIAQHVLGKEVNSQGDGTFVIS